MLRQKELALENQRQFTLDVEEFTYEFSRVQLLCVTVLTF